MKRMNCEICGRTMEKEITIVVDGTQFDVCEKCSLLGKKINEETIKEKELPRDRFAKERFDFNPRKKTEFQNFPQKIKNFSGSLQETTLIDGFGKKIMQARQRKGLKLKELAMKIYEKESVIQRIESEKFIPGEKTIKKLENELEINLRE